MSSSFACQFCSKVFSTKSNLTLHQQTTKYCLKIQNQKDTGFECTACVKKFTTKYYLKTHVCKATRDRESTEYKKQIDEYEQKIKEYEIRISQQEKTISILEDLLQQSQQTIKSALDKAIDKPTISTTSKTTNIRGNQIIQHILADEKTYNEQIDHERILSIARENIQNMEKYFWNGQRGMAQFCFNHIVKSDDGKMILCCTDPVRKRFKYMNPENIIKEDIDARLFTEKISLPIKKVCNEVFENIRKRIGDELEEKDKDAFEVDRLEMKMDKAMDNYIEIKNLDNNEKNGEYRAELSILLNI